MVTDEALSRGATSTPLLEETIGANLARTVAAHGDREAIVSVHQSIRWTYREFADRVEALARGLLGLGLETGDRLGLWSPNYAEWTLLQYATAEIGVILVNINPAYRTHELAYVLDQSGAACSWPRRVQDVELRGDGREPCAASCPGSSTCDLPVVAGVGRAERPTRAASPATRSSSGGRRSRRRRDQHPVHVGHDRVPEGRHAHAPQHPEQRLLHRRAAGLHAATTACASRCPSTTASAW